MADEVELSVLIAALKRHAGGPPVAASANWTTLRADRLLQLTSDHGMWGVLDRCWPAKMAHSAEAERARFAVSAMAACNVQRNTELRDDILRLAGIMADARIECVMLKGAAFIVESSDAAPWRVMSDIDVLVAPKVAQCAYDLLLSKGYGPTAAPERYREADHQHLSPLVAPNSRYGIELHTRLVWNQSRNPLKTEEVFAAASAVSTEEATILIPSPEHRMIHLVAHAQIGDRNYVARQIVLKDVADFICLSTQVTDWESVTSGFTSVSAANEWLAFISAVRLILGEAMPANPLNGQVGAEWAQKAIETLADPERARSRLILHLVIDYARRLVANPSNINLVIRTLVDRERRADFFGTQYRRWRR